MTETETSPNIEAAVEILQALADPTRLRILMLLADGRKNVGEINAAVGSCGGRTNSSFHLRLLRMANLVEDTREGRNVYYRLGPMASFDPKWLRVTVAGSQLLRVARV